MAQNSDRSFERFRVYRTNCYNDGPYTTENTMVLACEVTDTVYIDTYWNEPSFTPAGVYKWGVAAVYSGNRESEIVWSDAPTAQPVKLTDKARLTLNENVATSGLQKEGERPANINRGSVGFGTVVYSSSSIWTDGTGYYAFDIEDPADNLYVDNYLEINRGGEYANGYYYGFNNSGIFKELDYETNGWDHYYAAATDNASIVALAYNYVDGTMYGIDNSGTFSTYSQLVTVSLDHATFGEIVPVGDLGTSIMTLAINLHNAFRKPPKYHRASHRHLKYTILYSIVSKKTLTDSVRGVNIH